MKNVFCFLENRMKNAVLIPILAFFLVEAFMWYKYGVRTSWDTDEYLKQANCIQNLQPIDLDYVGYFSYSAFLAFVFSCGGNLVVVALLQIVIAAVAVYCFYRILQQFVAPSFCLFGSILFAIWPSVRSWDTFIYTESIFTSLIVICIFLLVFEWYKVGIFLVAITAFVRPPGFLFVFSLLLASGIFTNWRKTKTISLVAFSVLFLLVFDRFAETLIESYSNGIVIYPDFAISFKGETLSMPEKHDFKYLEIMAFVFSNPIFFMKLFFMKVYYFLFGIKPYFTFFHNIFNGISQSVFVLLSISVFMKSNLGSRLKIFSLSFILLNVLMIGMTTENWDGRFMVPLMPVFFLMSAIGMEQILISLGKKEAID